MTTREALLRYMRDSDCRSLRSACRSLGLPANKIAVLSRVLRGRPVSVRAENDLRVALGLAPLHVGTRTVPVCPDCGEVHSGRCYGRLVAGVAVLQPGQRVVGPPKLAKRRRRYWRPCLPLLSEAHRVLVVEFALALYAAAKEG